MKAKTEKDLNSWVSMMTFYDLNTEEKRNNPLSAILYIKHVKRFIKIIDNDPDVLIEEPELKDIYELAKITLSEYEEASKETGFAVVL